MDDLTGILPLKAKSRICAEERARRKAAVDYGRGSVCLEGFVVSAFVEELNRRFINGEITTAEHSAAIRRRHGL